MDRIIGVDPGKNGAWAVINDGVLTDVVKHAKTIELCRVIHSVPNVSYYYFCHYLLPSARS